MGYTHYWHRPEELDADTFKLFADDVKKIIRKIKPYVVIRGGNGEGEPEITDDIVLFNGNKEKGEWFERFLISRIEKKDKSWNNNDGILGYCKTGLQPYDKVVVASLIAFKYRFGDSVKVKFATRNMRDIRNGILLAENVIGSLNIDFIESLFKNED